MAEVEVEEAAVADPAPRRVAVVRVQIVVALGKLWDLTQCCVVGIEYIILDHVHVVHRAAVRSLAEVAPSRQLRRSLVRDPAIRRSRAHVHATQIAAVAKRPTETSETEALAMHRTSQRENHDLGKLISFTQFPVIIAKFPPCSDRSRSDDKNDKSRSRSGSPANHSPERNNESMED